MLKALSCQKTLASSIKDQKEGENIYSACHKPAAHFLYTEKALPYISKKKANQPKDKSSENVSSFQERSYQWLSGL